MENGAKYFGILKAINNERPIPTNSRMKTAESCIEQLTIFS